MLRREVWVEMATMAGMGMVDPYFNGTLNTGMPYCVRMFRLTQRYNIIFQDWFCLHPNPASLV